MHKFKFKPDDLFINRLKTYPEYNVIIYQGQMHVNTDTRLLGSGGITVYDVNTNRITDSVTPFVEVSSDRQGFKKDYFQPLVKNASSDFYRISEYANIVNQNNRVYSSFGSPGDQITSTYGNESPIRRNLSTATTSNTIDYFDVNSCTVTTAVINTRTVNLSASALHNVAKKYTTLSDHFIFRSSSIRSRDLVHDAGTINFLTIPNMYYGSTIKKGSVELNYYITGSKIASCSDINRNGTLVATAGSTSGSVVGLIMYDEGIIMLTSSLAIAQSDDNGIVYDGVSAATSSWKNFGTTLNDGVEMSDTLSSASYDLNFKGTNYVNSMTMFAHARKGHLNHSNNPTYRDLDQTRGFHTGSGFMFEEFANPIANIVSASYTSSSFDKTTYISKVHIYDEDGNLIAITSMAKPIKKTLNDEFTFKMKLDL
tara:strand:+ start:6817 stop:8094 length:1278 start_codon:yes stop_codon:yes gene_type:complete